MSVVKVVKIILQSLGVIFLIAGIGLTTAGMFTSRWQVAEFGPQLTHEHGLWKDCQNSENQNIKTINEWLCIFKFDKNNRDEKHQMKDWQLQVLCLLGSANALALIAAICALVSCCLPRYCTIPWAVVTFCATIVSAAALFLFYRWAHESENRFDTHLNMHVEQQYGTSFWLAVAGCLVYLLTTFVAILCAVIACVDSRREFSSPHKTWPKINHSHNTVV